MKLEFVGKKTKDQDGKHYVCESFSIGGYAVKVVDTSYLEWNSIRDIISTAKNFTDVQRGNSISCHLR